MRLTSRSDSYTPFAGDYAMDLQGKVPEMAARLIFIPTTYDIEAWFTTSMRMLWLPCTIQLSLNQYSFVSFQLFLVPPVKNVQPRPIL